MAMIRRLLPYLVMAGVSALSAAAAAAGPPVVQSNAVPAPVANGRDQTQLPAQQAYPEMRIAAVVNDDVITVADLAPRSPILRKRASA
jgi:precorrin-2 methylase